MKLKRIFSYLLISIIALGASAEKHINNTPSSSSRKAHAEAHSRQLANVKSHIDKSVIRDFIEQDVANREKNIISKEVAMLTGDLLKEAHKHLGKRYVRGAKGPSQFDCSGFSSYVYRQFGYSLSPSSRAQYTQGESVDRKELRAGDLVFFTSAGSGKNVGHVGIVVSADNEKGSFKFIHASLKGVKVSDCAEPYYQRRYIGARRIIKD